MEERIRARIAQLESMERDAMTQLTVIKNILAELRELIAPSLIISGDPLADPPPANGKEVHSGPLV